MVFLHKVKKGAADKSYGVHVAELAEMPETILQRARILLEQFEATNAEKPQAIHYEQQPPQSPQIAEQVAEDDLQLSLFSIEEEPAIAPEQQEVLDALKKLNVMGTTPMQAMTLLHELQQKLLGN